MPAALIFIPLTPSCQHRYVLFQTGERSRDEELQEQVVAVNREIRVVEDALAALDDGAQWQSDSDASGAEENTEQDERVQQDSTLQRARLSQRLGDLESKLNFWQVRAPVSMKICFGIEIFIYTTASVCVSPANLQACLPVSLCQEEVLTDYALLLLQQTTQQPCAAQ